jgi:hypothetical protein
MVRYVWEFVARADKVKEFERAYATSGSWARLFCKHDGYEGTMLLRDTENARRYLTIDCWQSATLQLEMRERSAQEYEELDRAFENLTESERHIGVFEDVTAEGN